MNKIKDLIGKKFGRLTVIKEYGKNKLGRILYECLCDCGIIKIIPRYSLVTGNTKSCGCLMIEKIKLAQTKHNHTKNNKASKTYEAYHHMIQRCTNPNDKSYKNYGGRTQPITVCRRWSNKKNGFQNFLKDMGECSPGLTLERINNNLGYYKSNCRWATRKEQNRNKRNNIVIPLNGKLLCLKDYCKIKNLNYNAIIIRINTLKWPLEKALTTSIKKRKKN
jgi:hypothetical protein